MNGSDLVVSVRLKADGSGLIGTARLAKGEVQSLGAASAAAGREAAALGAGTSQGAAGAASLATSTGQATAAAASLGTTASTTGTAARQLAADLGIVTAAAGTAGSGARETAGAIAAIAGAGSGARAIAADLGAAGAAAEALAGDARQAGAALVASAGNAGTYAADLARLRAEIDPLGEAQRRMAQAVDLADTAFKRGDLSADEYAAALQRAELIGRGQISSLGAQRQATMQLGQQTQDFFVQVSNGTSVATAFSQQIGQAAFAIQNMGGKMAPVAAFLTSGLGIGFTVLLTMAAPLIAKLFEGAEASDKLKKETLSLTDALDKERFGTDAATKAIEEYNKAQDRAIEQDSLAAERNREKAQARLAEALATREQTRALLEQRLVEEQAAKDAALAQQRYGKGEAATVAYQLASGRAAAVEADLAKADAGIARLQAQIFGLTKEISDAAVRAVDPIVAINQSFKRRDDELIRNAQGNERLTAALEAQRVALEKERVAKVAEAQARLRETASAGKQGQLTAFLSPVTGGRVTGGFGERRSDHAHAGVDYAVPVGTPVRAPAAGTIDVAGERQGYGNAIYINFGGGTTGRFGHLSKFNVKPGDVVDAGDIIGYTGGAPGEPGSGRSTGPHLHYEVRQNGKAVDPRAGRFRTDAGQAADDAQRQADAAEQRRERERLQAARDLEQSGRQAAASIASINGEFSAQPSLIERSRVASAALDATIADLEKRKPAGFEGLIAQAREAQAAIVDGIDRPIRDFVDQQRESFEVGQLVAAGQLDQADALRTILAMERERGQRLLPEQREAVLATVQALRAQERQIERNRQVQQLQLRTVDDIRQIITDTIYEGPGSLADLPGKLLDSSKRFQAELITEQLFGDTFEKLRDEITGADQVTDASARMAGAVDQVSAKVRTTSDALDQLAGASRGASAALGGTLPGVAAPLPGSTLGDDLLQRLFTGIPGLDADAAEPASASAEVLGGLLNTLSPGIRSLGAAADRLAAAALESAKPASAAAVPAPKRTEASEVYGKQITELIKKVGFSEDTASLIGKTAGKALGGAFEGQAAAGFASMLGIKTDNTGAAIGGAIGGLTGIPGGSIIGGLLGGIAGGLFVKPKYGTAAVTSVDGDATTSGSSGEFRAAAAGLAGSVQQGLSQIADQLGAELGQFSVAIGTFDGKYRVNTSATNSELHYKNFGHDSLFNFDKDEGAAISFAIADAIKDGAILGLSAAQEAALRSTDDLDRALSEAMKVGQLELDLAGVPGQLEKIFKDFDRTAAERVTLAKKYGLDLLAVEKLNAEQRADLLEDTLNARVGSLKDLLSNLQYGDLFEGSASDRRDAILGEIADAKEDADAGVEGATDRLADLYRRLTETSREAFGTAGSEYADDRAAALAGVEKAIQMESDRVKAAEEAARAQAAAAAAGNALTNETNDLLAQANRYLAELAAGGGGGGGAFTPDLDLVSR